MQDGVIKMALYRCLSKWPWRTTCADDSICDSKQRLLQLGRSGAQLPWRDRGSGPACSQCQSFLQCVCTRVCTLYVCTLWCVGVCARVCAFVCVRVCRRLYCSCTRASCATSRNNNGETTETQLVSWTQNFTALCLHLPLSFTMSRSHLTTASGWLHWVH